MIELLKYFLIFEIGVSVGVGIMCLFQVNKIED